ncbi:hypothetical protein DMN91_006686 [Ooceraea biroi]|uniref:Multiple inositol polyphosphate phosphatase n=1 Tax=Ooceraea biroi TaxID=2015173 RepID=A0A3L8DI13_OOCBI|nr:hypothetical protein DMN91_006686 [Ooceraea biroi]
MYGKLGLFILLVFILPEDTKSRMIKTVNRFRCDAGNSYPYTGIKTPYSKVYNGTINHINLPKFGKSFSDCKPLQIWLLCRHGTRFPKTTKILEMLNMTRFRDLIVNNHEIDHRE